MSGQGFQETLVCAQASGPALTGITQQSLLGTTADASSAAKFTLPAGFFKADGGIGRALRVTCKGRISNIITTPGTLLFELKFGSIVVWSSGTVALNAVAKTNVTFIMDALLRCDSVGSGTLAKLLGIGQFQSESVVGAAAGTTVSASLPASAPVVGNGFDSTASQLVDLFATFSLTGNSIQMHEYMLESLN